MTILDPTQISSLINDFINNGPNPALFAGAGVGVRAGLPSWNQYIDHLATIAEKYSKTEGEIIRERAKNGHLIKAASSYKSSPIPKGELFSQLAKPFEKPPAPEKLNALISLPFSAIFTTNYDRSMHHSYAAVVGKDALCVELEDPTMTRAPFMQDFYIARVHGRVEVPETIVVDESDFKRIETPTYFDFMKNCFTRYRCLFIGYSFLDPAITSIFRLIEDRLGPNFPLLHLAIVPQDAAADFLNEFHKFNIQVAFYNAGIDHSILWEGIKLASRAYDESVKVVKPKSTPPLRTLHKFISAAYARSSLGSEITPLRYIVIDGMILEILNSQSSKSIEINDIPSKLQVPLSLPNDECKKIADNRIKYLAGQGLCNIDGTKLILKSNYGNDLEKDLLILSEAVLHRLLVRHGVKLESDFIPQIASILEDTLVARGWDLGASYVGEKDLEDLDLSPTVKASLSRHNLKLSVDNQKLLILSCVDLFQSPDETESRLLAHLGRISFALQLVLNSPSNVLNYDLLLPQKLYLDSNILMRAIVDGHPSRPVYVNALRRLSESSQKIGKEIPVLVQKGFLNEIIANRNIAIREVNELGLENPDSLRNHILYYGVERINVFIVAYSSWVGRLNEKISFEKFLTKVAPYRNIDQLINFIKRQGIQEQTYQGNGTFKTNFDRIFLSLKDSYDQDSRSKFDKKDPILIENEARQLAMLSIDLEQGNRSIFVTGDKRLQRCCSGTLLSKPGAMIISNRQFVQLVDLLLGLDIEEGSMARLLWGTTSSEEAVLLLNFFTNLALQHYSTAEATALPKVLDSFIPMVQASAKKENVQLFPWGSLESKSKKAKFLDRFEDRFYENMARAIKEYGDSKK